MQIELSYLPGRFDRFDICQERGIETIRKRPEGWSLFIKNNEDMIIRVSPISTLCVRYEGHVYDSEDDDQLAILKHKLETDFAIEHLE